MFLWSGAWGANSPATPLEHPPLTKAKSAANASRHGKRVRLYAIASHLWGRLDTDNPAEHQAHEVGFAGEVIGIAKRWAWNIRMGIEESTARASNSWRSKARHRAKHGGAVLDLHVE